ncbi:MAG: DUF1836 domain-containing protein [Eubacteriales bacterium]|nr:DUF1836 domain-containing protein [Eubacteriales bacterium]
MIQLQNTDFLKTLSAYHPVTWEQIPDLGLYMDQVVTFLERQCQPLYGKGERVFTPAMVNNYVKLGLVARPVGKKYGREQLAQLLMICIFKQAASADGMKKLLTLEDGQTIEALYTHFCTMQAQVLEEMWKENELPSTMICAIHCAAYRFLCNAILSEEAHKPEAEPEEKQP